MKWKPGDVSIDLGSWLLDAGMQQTLHVALTFVVLHHLIQAVANRRPQRVKHPATLRATPTLSARGFDPYHLPHEMLLKSELSALSSPSLFAMKIN
jgi:hypothetical protein